MQLDADDINARIRAVGERFVGRLDQAVLDDALEYLDHAEAGPAVEILCAQLHEYGVALSHEELQHLRGLLTMFGRDEEYAYLAELVRPPGVEGPMTKTPGGGR